MRKIRKFGLINLIALVLVVLILSFIPSATVILKNNSDVDILENEEEYCGIIEIWHIDSFEGGTTSKEFYLNSVSNAFMKGHKGTYVHITNLSVDGLINNLNNNKLPDIFSFGSGIGEYIKEYIKEISLKNDLVFKNLLESGEISGVQYSIPYTLGLYFIFTTEENLINAGASIDMNLITEFNNCGYSYKTRKNTVEVKSITYGENDYISPLASLYYSNNSKKTELKSEMLPYDAYAGFVGFNTSTLLLGTHRDLARLVQKQNMGKLQGLVSYPLDSYTDLVQYIAISRSGDSVREKLSEEYLNLCLLEENQKQLSQIGMLPVINLNIYSEDGYYMAFEKSFKESTIIPNCFETLNDRDIRKNMY